MKNDIKKKKDGKTTSAMLLGVLVCFVLIAVYGIVSQLKVSYAFPTAFDQISADNVESVTSDTKKINYKPENAPASWKTLEYKFASKTKAIEGVTYTLDMFCLEMLKEVPSANDDQDAEDEDKNVSFVRQSTNKYIDEGISSIIISAYDNATVNTQGSNVSVTLSNDNYYNAQIAIWIYQNLTLLEKQSITIDDVTGRDAEEKQQNLENMIELQGMWNSIKTSHDTGAAKAIYNYVENATTSQTITTENTISLDGEVELKLTDDKKYYQTDLLKVEITKAVNTEFNGFTFNISSDNKDVEAELIDEDGNVIADYKNIENKKFRIRLDASKLPSNSTTSLTGDISGVFKHISFKEYKAEDDVWQIALLAASTSKDESVPLKLSVTVPDTGAGYTGYIYIIGALVLIVGLTVIYVNTKVQEN